MKIRRLLDRKQASSQLFSSAVSAQLIIGLILFDPLNADAWSLAYSSYLILLVLVRSLFSEPIIYNLSISLTSHLLRKALFVSISTSMILGIFFYLLSNNIFFLFLMVPSVINAIQDFTRYGLIALDLKKELVITDIFWFSSTFFFFISFYLSSIANSLYLFLFIWSFFGIMACLRNLGYINRANIQKPQSDKTVIGFLEFSLLLDKIFPRVASEAQYFLLNVYYQNTIAEYRIANLLMGFSNILVMSQTINWVRERKTSLEINLRQIILIICFLNLFVAGLAFKLTSHLVSLFVICLSVAAIQDLWITKRVITLRLQGSKYVVKSVALRVTASLLLLIGFTVTLVNLPFPWSVASAAAIGSFISLLSLRFYK